MNEHLKYFKFQKFKQGDLRSNTSKRQGDMKIGFTLSNLTGAKYVILGVEESIGPRANHGRGGAENAFGAFLNYFLNMQANETLAGDEIHVLGKITCISEFEENPVELRKIVSELDEFVYDILKSNINENQIPILIGGGHNNSLPLMRFSQERFNQAIQVVNFDAHADYRILEGRHSGNSFSYAFLSGYMKKYNVIGLHKRYNSQQILNDLRKDGHFFTFHEDYVFGNRNYQDELVMLYQLFSETEDYIGVELDMDTIERMPSSAYSPIGIPTELGRIYMNIMGSLEKTAYLHLPEAAPNNELEKIIAGKSLAYFVSDFITANGG